MKWQAYLYLCLYTLLLLILLAIVISDIGNIGGYDIEKNPQTYILKKMSSNDIVLLGTYHKKNDILQQLLELIPDLPEAGVTHIGLEICSDQQQEIDRFLEKGEGLNGIGLHFQIDCSKYRSVLSEIQAIDEEKRPSVVALDLPKSMYNGKMSRDEWMALSIANTFQRNPNAKMVVIVGNLHVLKGIEWGEMTPFSGFIPFHLKELAPHLRVFSIGQCIDKPSIDCDFSRKFSAVQGAVALDCSEAFGGWKIGITELIAAKRKEVYEALDGLIVY